MRFVQITALVSLLVATSTLAGYNCKCQDANGQYNDLTATCCEIQSHGNVFTSIHYPGPNHQCTSNRNEIDSGKFVDCCKQGGVGGAYCWK